MRGKIRPAVEPLEGKQLLSGLAAGLAGSIHVARSGNQETLTFTVTNVSNKDIDVVHGATNSGFVATQKGQVVWISNNGIEPDNLINEILKPHQSLSITEYWNGTSDVGGSTKALSGAVNVTNELDPTGASVNVELGPIKMITPPKPPAHKFG